LAPVKADALYEQEFQKGEMAGIRLFMKLPEMAIEDLAQQLKEEQNDEPDEAAETPPSV
jgi:hypothetical protein